VGKAVGVQVGGTGVEVAGYTWLHASKRDTNVTAPEDRTSYRKSRRFNRFGKWFLFMGYLADLTHGDRENYTINLPGLVSLWREVSDALNDDNRTKYSKYFLGIGNKV
jgi:hypothetical protein